MPPVTPRDCVQAVLKRRTPARFVYAPNYWQWFNHHRSHKLLEPPVRHCASQLELIRHLGLDVFSRNLYCDPTQRWFGGLAEEVWDGLEVTTSRHVEGQDVIMDREFHTRAGTLSERLRYVFAESTLVQEKYLLDDYASQLRVFAELVRCRRWRFRPERHAEAQQMAGSDGLVVAGELFSPLKLLHFAAGPTQSVYMLMDHPEQCREILAQHEAAQLDLVRQMLAAQVPAMMSMDNLDAMFHTPAYVENCSARYYERASALCHQAGATFWIHACGRQKPILPLIASLGVDGLEGVAFPPLGDVQLDEALRLAGDRLIITGGISAVETEQYQTYDDVRRYVWQLLSQLRPYAHRFMLSASCNTSIRTPWRVIEWFRDAWQEFGSLN
jgi:hypothetical protein